MNFADLNLLALIFAGLALVCVFGAVWIGMCELVRGWERERNRKADEAAWQRRQDELAMLRAAAGLKRRAVPLKLVAGLNGVDSVHFVIPERKRLAGEQIEPADAQQVPLLHFYRERD